MKWDTKFLEYVCLEKTDKLMKHLFEKYQNEGAILDTISEFLYVPRGSKVLAVAHLDTVADDETPRYEYVQANEVKDGITTVKWVRGKRLPSGASFKLFHTQKGDLVNSIALDDRLGVWVLTSVLPSLGIKPDLLFTTGEEKGMSSAMYFQPPKGVEYNWMFSFDRRDSAPVLYEYDDDDMRERLKSINIIPTFGSFSDICYLEHLGIKGINWGTCYQNEHGDDCFANLRELQASIRKFKKFWERFYDIYMEHTHYTPRYSRFFLPDRTGWDNADLGWSLDDADYNLRDIKRNHAVSAMEDFTTHVEYAINRGGLRNPRRCTLCGAGLYYQEQEAGLCSFCVGGENKRPKCEYCDDYLYGEEIGRGLCQNCAEEMREGSMYDEIFYKKSSPTRKVYVEEEEEEVFVECKACGETRNVDIMIYVHEIGNMCPMCYSKYINKITFPTCSRCGTALIGGEVQRGLCSTCETMIEVLSGGG